MAELVLSSSEHKYRHKSTIFTFTGQIKKIWLLTMFEVVFLTMYLTQIFFQQLNATEIAEGVCRIKNKITAQLFTIIVMSKMLT